MNIIKFSIVIFLLSAWSQNTYGQIMVGGKIHSLRDYVGYEEIHQLKADFGSNKLIPEHYELQILLALSHFPELKNTKIDFVEKKVFAPLSALPSISSMIIPLRERKYRVIISEKSNAEMERILLKNLPINAQVGVIGHELSHVVDYDQKSISELIAVAINYGINPSYHAWFEKNTDLRTIEHGLGWELYSYSKYVRTLFGSEERQVNLADDFYLHFNEILFEMQKLELYNVFFQPNSVNKR